MVARHGCLTSSTRKPLLEVSRVHGIPSSVPDPPLQAVRPQVALHDEVGHAARRPAGAARCAAARGAPPCRPGSAGWTRSGRTAGRPGCRRRCVACTPSSPSAAALRRVRSSARSLTSSAQTVAPGERRAEGEGDRAPAAAEVEEGAGGRRRGRLVEQHGGALVEPAGREDAGRHLDLDRRVRPGARVSAPALVGARRGGREVVVGLAHRRHTLAGARKKPFAPGRCAVRP